MENQIKNVTYKTTNTYETLNKLTSQTKRVWVVFHGIGFLSRFFLKYFNELPKNENYIIAPQAPSKYYLKNEYKHVGASWLTKENTALETANLYNYLDAVMAHENLPTNSEIVFFGFSQGISIALRYLAYSKLNCSKLILYAGGVPTELKKSDFTHLKKDIEIVSVFGNKDQYLTPDKLIEENNKLKILFGDTIQYLSFDGGHEVKKEIINKLAE
ncbi:Predicted esterase [Maribacter aquivivus]|uniref:Predicted esterase n=1 Tax=Maribacter aquivivus TaxID=228958 RepID=A0A1M6TWE9_9FLAO|nr:esterase [Maribacter aquivivus]SHK61256.1 Predicted esterase [Maribacter aquivivus]